MVKQRKCVFFVDKISNVVFSCQKCTWPASWCTGPSTASTSSPTRSATSSSERERLKSELVN
jgi:hypothetical protein